MVPVSDSIEDKNDEAILILVPDIAQAMAAAKRIRNMRPQEDGETFSSLIDMEDIEVDEKESGGRGVKIELKNVSFKYPTRDVPVLNGINMTVSIRILR